MQRALSERALLVRLAISQWYNRKTDRSFAMEVAAAHGVKNSEDSYTKVLLPRKALASVTSSIASIRAYHYMHTLPWTSEAIRILPSAGYFDYMAGMKERKDEFEICVRDFSKTYVDHISAARISKSTMFNEQDYPPVATIESAFGVQVSCMPIPTDGDFRIALDAGTIQELEDKVRDESTTALAAVTQEVYARLVDNLVPYQIVLSDPEKQFHATTIQRAYIMAEMVPILNLAEDAALNHAAERVTEELSNLEPEVLRDDKVVRAQAAKIAGEILNELAAAKKSKENN